MLKRSNSARGRIRVRRAGTASMRSKYAVGALRGQPLVDAEHRVERVVEPQARRRAAKQRDSSARTSARCARASYADVASERTPRRHAERLERNALAVEHPEHVMVGHDQQRRRVGERRVVGEPLRIGVAVRADDRQVAHRRVERRGRAARGGIGGEEPVGMEFEGDHRIGLFDGDARPRGANEIAEPARHRRREPRLVVQVLAEDRADREQPVREPGGIAAMRCRERREIARRADRRRRSPTLLVFAGDVAHPARNRECREFDRPARGEVVAHRGEEALRQLLRAVHRDLLRAVRQRGVARSVRTSASR